MKILDVYKAIDDRIADLDLLLKQVEPKSNHYYALTAGKYELLLLGVKLSNMRSEKNEKNVNFS